MAGGGVVRGGVVRSGVVRGGVRGVRRRASVSCAPTGRRRAHPSLTHAAARAAAQRASERQRLRPCSGASFWVPAPGPTTLGDDCCDDRCVESR